MSGLVIYNSKYGSTKEYAVELAKKMKWEALSYKNVNVGKLNETKEIVLASSVRMGKMKITGWAKNKAGLLKDKCKAVIAVGGTESGKQDYYVEIVEKNLPFLNLKKDQIYGLGGRQIISEMKGFDAFVFKMLDKMMKDDDECKKEILQEVYHMDMKLLVPIVTYLKNS